MRLRSRERCLIRVHAKSKGFSWLRRLSIESEFRCMQHVAVKEATVTLKSRLLFIWETPIIRIFWYSHRSDMPLVLWRYRLLVKILVSYCLNLPFSFYPCLLAYEFCIPRDSLCCWSFVGVIWKSRSCRSSRCFDVSCDAMSMKFHSFLKHEVILASWKVGSGRNLVK